MRTAIPAQTSRTIPRRAAPRGTRAAILEQRKQEESKTSYRCSNGKCSLQWTCLLMAIVVNLVQLTSMRSLWDASPAAMFLGEHPSAPIIPSTIVNATTPIETKMLRSANTATTPSVTTPPMTPKAVIPSSAKPHRQAQQLYYPPRIFIGILSDSQTHAAAEMRDRQRALFRYWSDDFRFCTLQEFIAKQNRIDFIALNEYNSDHECQVVYTFVMGAYSTNSSLVNHAPKKQHSMMRLGDTPQHPLEIAHEAMPGYNGTNAPPYQDIFDHKDGIFLNIFENMENGKTPTYFYWASKITKEWKIPYIAKCDTDTFLFMDRLFALVQKSLPPIPMMIGDGSIAPTKQPSLMTGRMWHKPWKWIRTVDNSFWEEQFYNGMHFYLLGGFYLMSRDLAEDATAEAWYYRDSIPKIVNYERSRKPKGGTSHGYLEGVEDHDETAMANVGHFRSLKSNHTAAHPSVIQWLTTPKLSQPFRHPMKNGTQWFNYLANTTALYEKYNVKKVKKTHQPLHQKKKSSLPKPPNHKTLMMVYDFDDNAPSLESYRQALQGDGACSVLENTNSCDVEYLFLTGKNKTVEHVLHRGRLLKTVLKKAVPAFTEINSDTLVNGHVAHNDHLGLALAAFEHLKLTLLPKFDVIIFCKASAHVDLQQWKEDIISTAQYSLTGPHKNHLLIGDVREKFTLKDRHEFPLETKAGVREFFLKKYKTMQLYLGSDCFAISASLVPAMLAAAKSKDVIVSFQGTGHLGHDLSFLAYMHNHGDMQLHWMPVPKAMQFWRPKLA